MMKIHGMAWQPQPCLNLPPPASWKPPPPFRGRLETSPQPPLTCLSPHIKHSPSPPPSLPSPPPTSPLPPALYYYLFIYSLFFLTDWKAASHTLHTTLPTPTSPPFSLSHTCTCLPLPAFLAFGRRKRRQGLGLISSSLSLSSSFSSPSFSHTSSTCPPSQSGRRLVPVWRQGQAGRREVVGGGRGSSHLTTTIYLYTIHAWCGWVWGHGGIFSWCKYALLHCTLHTHTHTYLHHLTLCLLHMLTFLPAPAPPVLLFTTTTFFYTCSFSFSFLRFWLEVWLVGQGWRFLPPSFSRHVLCCCTTTYHHSLPACCTLPTLSDRDIHTYLPTALLRCLERKEGSWIWGESEGEKGGRWVEHSLLPLPHLTSSPFSPSLTTIPP